MKPNRLLLGLLFAGALLGTSMVSSTINANAATFVSATKQRDTAEKVTLTKKDVEISDGVIRKLTSKAVAEKLIDGAALIIPDGLATRIDDKVFRDYEIKNLAGKEGPGISSLDAPSIKEIGEEAFEDNQISSVNLPKVEKLKTHAFRNNKLTELTLPEVTEIIGEAFNFNNIQKLNLPKVVSIGSWAFANNRLVDVSLPNVQKIEEGAFRNNQIETLNLPKVESIGYFTFGQNQIAHLELPEIKTIDDEAFYGNKLTSVSLPPEVKIKEAAFSKQFPDSPHVSEAINSTSLKFQEILDSQKLSFMIGKVEQLTPNKISIEGASITVDNDQKTIANPKQKNPINLEINASDVGYSIFSQLNLTSRPPVTPPVTPPTTNPSGSSNQNNTTPPTTAPKPTEPITPEKPTPEAPNYAEKKGAAVYAIRGIYLYKSPNFTKSQRIAKYPKQKRINRPMFVITDYARSRGGALRFKVRDVNHTRKSAGKVGYITANQRYVVPAYYQSVPKGKKITVISKKGIHAYKNETLTGRQKSYRKGTRLTVKKLVKHNLTTRYQLSNGYYVSGNKKLVIQGKY